MAVELVEKKDLKEEIELLELDESGKRKLKLFLDRLARDCGDSPVIEDKRVTDFGEPMFVYPRPKNIEQVLQLYMLIVDSEGKKEFFLDLMSCLESMALDSMREVDGANGKAKMDSLMLIADRFFVYRYRRNGGHRSARAYDDKTKFYSSEFFKREIEALAIGILTESLESDDLIDYFEGVLAFASLDRGILSDCEGGVAKKLLISNDESIGSERVEEAIAADEQRTERLRGLEDREVARRLKLEQLRVKSEILGLANAVLSAELVDGVPNFDSNVVIQAVGQIARSRKSSRYFEMEVKKGHRDPKRVYELYLSYLGLNVK